jgi:sulfite oxidase
MRVLFPTASVVRALANCSSSLQRPAAALATGLHTQANQQQQHYRQRQRHHRGHGRLPTAQSLAALAGVAAALTVSTAFCEQKRDDDNDASPPPLVPGDVDPALPTYSLEQVQEHTGAKKNGVWVVYRHGVYEISTFIASHPGGTKILLAAGKSIEPFWQLYAAHNHADVHRVLESLRIGNLRAEDVALLDAERKARYGDGPYSQDPLRHPALKVNSSMPFNAEPPPELLMESFITPNDLFFVRNHLPVPTVDVDAYTLKVAGLGIGDRSESGGALVRWSSVVTVVIGLGWFSPSD